jgi:hypothetical protein
MIYTLYPSPRRLLLSSGCCDEHRNACFAGPAAGGRAHASRLGQKLLQRFPMSFFCRSRYLSDNGMKPGSISRSGSSERPRLLSRRAATNLESQRLAEEDIALEFMQDGVVWRERARPRRHCRSTLQAQARSSPQRNLLNALAAKPSLNAT